MFTATLIGDTKNIELRRRMVNVEFTDGVTTFAKEFQFKIDETVTNIKKTVTGYLDEINTVLPVIDSVTNYVEPTPVTPTQAELDKQAWEDNWQKLQTVDKLIAAQILTGSETAVVNLRNKVKTDFKQSYI